MSNEKEKDSLSAMMDDEAEELEVRRVLTDADDELLVKWSRYHVVRSVLHKEPVFPKLDILSAISEAIAHDNDAVKDTIPAEKQSPGWSIGIGKLAVAATILAVALSTVYFCTNAGVSDIVENIYATNDEAVDSTNVVLIDQQVDEKVIELIERHERQSFLIDEKTSIQSNKQ